MKVEGLERVVAVLRARAAAATRDSNVSVAVGYTASYALYVHENLEARHKPGKQAQYLVGPARALQHVIGGIVRTALAWGATLAQGLLLAGLRIQRESMMVVPVDTGALRASAFTELEKGGR